jgi:HSP20 family molecular chaperone IbpA
MQSTAAMKPIQQNGKSQPVSTHEIFGQANMLAETIARRAFELFKYRGGVDGNDLDDWLRAEAEFFHPAHLHLYESHDALGIIAEVPGFAPEELSINVEPRRVTITGKRATNHRLGRILYYDACADRIFRAVGLPVEVDPKKATAALNNGVLELAMPKVALGHGEVPRTYSIVRAEDFRLWSESFLRAVQPST